MASTPVNLSPPSSLPKAEPVIDIQITTELACYSSSIHGSLRSNPGLCQRWRRAVNGEVEEMRCAASSQGLLAEAGWMGQSVGPVNKTDMFIQDGHALPLSPLKPIPFRSYHLQRCGTMPDVPGSRWETPGRAKRSLGGTIGINLSPSVGDEELKRTVYQGWASFHEGSRADAGQ